MHTSDKPDAGVEVNQDIARARARVLTAKRELEAAEDELERLEAEKRAMQAECGRCGDCSVCLG